MSVYTAQSTKCITLTISESIKFSNFKRHCLLP